MWSSIPQNSEGTILSNSTEGCYWILNNDSKPWWLESKTSTLNPDPSKSTYDSCTMSPKLLQGSIRYKITTLLRPEGRSVVVSFIYWKREKKNRSAFVFLELEKTRKRLVGGPKHQACTTIWCHYFRPENALASWSFSRSLSRSPSLSLSISFSLPPSLFLPPSHWLLLCLCLAFCLQITSPISPLSLFRILFTGVPRPKEDATPPRTTIQPIFEAAWSKKMSIPNIVNDRRSLGVPLGRKL